MHLSRPTEYTPSGLNPNVNHGFLTAAPSIVTNTPLWERMLIMGKAVHKAGEFSVPFL